MLNHKLNNKNINLNYRSSKFKKFLKQSKHNKILCMIIDFNICCKIINFTTNLHRNRKANIKKTHNKIMNLISS